MTNLLREGKGVEPKRGGKTPMSKKGGGTWIKKVVNTCVSAF